MWCGSGVSGSSGVDLLVDPAVDPVVDPVVDCIRSDDVLVGKSGVR